MNLNDLVAFVRTAELGTFSRAADELGVPKSTVSRRVSRLEEALGMALLVRSSRSFVLSDDGRALYERASPALREVADVERDLLDSASTPRGLLRLTASIDFGSQLDFAIRNDNAINVKSDAGFVRLDRFQLD